MHKSLAPGHKRQGFPISGISCFVTPPHDIHLCFKVTTRTPRIGIFTALLVIMEIDELQREIVELIEVFSFRDHEL